MFLLTTRGLINLDVQLILFCLAHFHGEIKAINGPSPYLTELQPVPHFDMIVSLSLINAILHGDIKRNVPFIIWDVFIQPAIFQEGWLLG